MTWVSNKCGGKRFRTLPDGRVEVEGVGIPTFAKGSPQYNYLKQTWKNWSLYFRWYAARNDILPSNVLAIATKETGIYSGDKKKQETVGSPAGAVGVMQIMPCRVFPGEPFHSLVCGSNRQKGRDSIKIGSKLLATKIRSNSGLPAAASSYNAGSLRCYEGPTTNPAVTSNQFNWHNEHDYASDALAYNNTAIEMGVNKPPLWPWIAGSLLASAGVIVFLSRDRGLRR